MSNSESPLALDSTAIAPLEHALRSGIVKEGGPSQRTWELVSLAVGQVIDAGVAALTLPSRLALDHARVNQTLHRAHRREHSSDKLPGFLPEAIVGSCSVLPEFAARMVVARG